MWMNTEELLNLPIRRPHVPPLEQLAEKMVSLNSAAYYFQYRLSLHSHSG